MKTKISFLLFGIICFAGSCKQSAFMMRKYTRGIYFENKKEVSANTTPAGQKLFASISKTNTALHPEHLLLELPSANCKDTVFIIQKGRKAKTIRKACPGPIIKIVLQDTTDQRCRTKTKRARLEQSSDKESDLKALKQTANAAMFSFWLPVGGLLISLHARNLYLKTFKKYPKEDLRRYRVRSQLSFLLSLPFFLLGILICVVFILGFLAFGL